MFRIEDAIVDWKLQLNQHQTMTASDIEEMESHLRDEMDTLVSTGLTQEEAFMIASGRIGKPDDISREFAKINTTAIWKNRFFWMIAGILVSYLISATAGLTVKGGFLVGMEFQQINMFYAGIALPLLNTLGVIVLSLICYGLLSTTAFFQRLWSRKKWGLILTLGVLTMVLNILAAYLPSLWMAKRYGAEQFGQFCLGSSYSSFGITVIWPIFLAILMLWLSPRKAQSV